jgi:hypothetical protein
LATTPTACSWPIASLDQWTRSTRYGLSRAGEAVVPDFSERPEADVHPSPLRAPLEKVEVGAPPMLAIAEHHFAVT